MRKPFLPLVVLAVVALGASACVSTGGSSSDRGRSDLLIRAQIEESTQSNAFDLVRQERPGWLRIRGPNSINHNQPLAIYLDGVRLGGPETLTTIPIMAVERMQYLGASEAQTRYGLNNTQGAIAVTTRHR